MNHKIDAHTPRFDVQLLFDEIGVALDRDQYRDLLSLLDMYHVYLRQHQVRPQSDFTRSSYGMHYSIADTGQGMKTSVSMLLKLDFDTQEMPYLQK